MFLCLEGRRRTQRRSDSNRVHHNERTPKRLGGRERQLMFLRGALERFRRALDSINYLIVFLDWHQSNDLVLASRSIVLECPFEIDKLTNRIFMHRWPAGCRRCGTMSRLCALA